MTCLVQLLNRRVYAEKLSASWAREDVAALSRVFFRLDPVGLGLGGCPSDEYEPEALRVVARLHGFASEEELWAAPRPAQVEASEEKIRSTCEEAFSALFGGDFSGAFDEEGFAAEALNCALGQFRNGASDISRAAQDTQPQPWAASTIGFEVALKTELRRIYDA